MWAINFNEVDFGEADAFVAPKVVGFMEREGQTGGRGGVRISKRGVDREGTALLGTKMGAVALLLTPRTPEGRGLAFTQTKTKTQSKKRPKTKKFLSLRTLR